MKPIHSVASIILLVVLNSPMLNAEESTTSPRDVNAAQPWWQNAVIYEIYTRSFADSDGDGIGDLPGINSRLDYLAGLGVDAIWLTPFYPSPNADFGYDIADYVAVGPEYGTLADFDRLVAEAGERGIRVITDLVLNHTSDQHAWFLESRSSRSAAKRDWYIWRDGTEDGPPNNWQSIFGGSAWEYDEETDQYFYHFFYKEQPDLNWRNPEVRTALSEVARFWLDRGVAGFRLDAPDTLLEDEGLTDNPTLPGVNWVGDPRMENRYNVGLPEVHDIIRDFRATIDTYPGALLLGETGSPETIEELARWYGENGDELHLAMNFLFTGVRELDASEFRRRIAEAGLNPAGGWPVFFLSNHDRRRQLSRYGDGQNDAEIAKLLATMLLTVRGTPILYYGEEIGMVNHDPQRLEDVRDPIGRLFWPQFKGRDGSRTPMQWDDGDNAGFSRGTPWLPIPSSATEANVDVQSQDSDSVLGTYKRLLALRRTRPALRGGEWVSLTDNHPEVLAYLRHSMSETVLVALNMSDAVQTLTLDLKPWNTQTSTVETILSSHGSSIKPRSLEGLRLEPFESFVGRVDTVEATLTRLKQDLVNAYIARDAIALDRIHCEGFTVTDANGRVRTKADEFAGLEDRTSTLLEGHYDPIAIRVFGDVAVFYGHGELDGEGTDGPWQARYDSFNVFARRDGGWCYVAAFTP